MFNANSLTMPSDKPRITIRVSEEELEELQQAADQQYRTVPSLVLVLVKQFLDERHKAKSSLPLLDEEDNQSVFEAETIAEIVQQNYYGLLSDGKIKPDILQKIAEGEEPSKPDIYRIANFLNVEARELLALRDRTFRSKRKEPNG